MKPDHKIAIRPLDLEWLAQALKLDDVFSETPALEHLLGSLPTLRFEDWPKGAEVIREGDKGDDFFVIRSGSVCVRCRGSKPKARKIGALKGGDFFGEIGFLFKAARSATVLTETRCRIFRFPARDFADLLRKHRVLSDWVKKVASARLPKIMKGLPKSS